MPDPHRHLLLDEVAVFALDDERDRGLLAEGEDLLGLETTFTVKRSEFGMSNMVGPVGDEAQVTVAVELSKK